MSTLRILMHSSPEFIEHFGLVRRGSVLAISIAGALVNVPHGGPEIMRRLFLVPALGVAALALTAPLQAQTRGWRDDGRAYSAQQSFYDSGRVAYDNGFREGLKQGEKDGRKSDPFRYQDEKTFQRADKGYHREYGSVDRYRQSFRTGYSTGYSEAYQRYAPNYGYGGNGRYGNGRAVPRRDVGGYGYPNGSPSNRADRLSVLPVGSRGIWRLRWLLRCRHSEWRERRLRKGSRGCAEEPIVRSAAS